MAVRTFCLILFLVGSRPSAGVRDVSDVEVDEKAYNNGQQQHHQQQQTTKEVTAKETATNIEPGPGWMAECYENKRLWRDGMTDLAVPDVAEKCMLNVTGDDISALENSQGFCPTTRNQNGGAACPRDGVKRDVKCTYDKAGKIDGGRTEIVTPPALYAEESSMRYGDPLYVIDAANPPMSPFVNVNRIYSNTDPDSKISEIWAGQCPLVMKMETRTNGDENKESTVCEWLNWIKTTEIKTLVSLAPNPKEIVESRVKMRCQDYIGRSDDWKVDGNVCGKVMVVHEQTEQSFDVKIKENTRVAHVYTRTVTFDGYDFTQIYFDSWPDAHGSDDPIAATPSEEAYKAILKGVFALGQTVVPENSGYKVAIHCAGGRGRTGTVATGLVVANEYGTGTLVVNEEFTSAKLAKIVVDMRQYRADMVEDPYQLYMVSKVFGKAKEECKLREDVE